MTYSKFLEIITDYEELDFDALQLKYEIEELELDEKSYLLFILLKEHFN